MSPEPFPASTGLWAGLPEASRPMLLQRQYSKSTPRPKLRSAREDEMVELRRTCASHSRIEPDRATQYTQEQAIDRHFFRLPIQRMRVFRGRYHRYQEFSTPPPPS